VRSCSVAVAGRSCSQSLASAHTAVRLQSDRKTRPFGILESSCGRCGLVESPQPPERNTPQFQTRTLHNPSDGKTDRQWVLHLSSRHISERNGCTQVHQQVSKGSQIRRPLVTVVTVSPRRKALCHLFMSRWFRVRFERRLAAASGLTLTEVGSNADGQVPVESCGLRSAPSLGVPRVSGVAAEVALFGRERAPPEGGGVRHSGVGNARVVSAVRPVRPVGDGEQQPAHAVVVLARRRRRLSTLSVRVMRGRYATSCRRP
jgi:hypothetical protein